MLATIAVGGAAQAQTLTVNISGGVVDLGRVSAKSSGQSLLTISPSGVVTVPAGSGANVTRRITAGAVNTPTVTITCTDGQAANAKCANQPVYVTFRGTTASGPAQAPDTFTVSGTASVISGPTGGNHTTYQLNALTSGVARSFTVGMDVGIKSSSTLGAGTFAFSAAAGFNSPAASPIDTGTGAVYGMRPLSLTKSSDLNFGRVVKPKTGSSELVVSPDNNRSLTGGDATLIGTAFTRAAYTVTGEGGQTISVGAPAFDMTNGSGGSVTVTPIVPEGASLSSGGSYSFNLGGRFTLTPSTPSGSYSGSFTTTVAYN